MMRFLLLSLLLSCKGRLNLIVIIYEPGIDMNRFIDLCYEITKKTGKEFWTLPQFFVFRTLGEYTQIDTLNMSSTILYKIRVPRKEIGLYIKNPLILWTDDAEKHKLKLKRGDSYHRFQEDLSVMSKYDPIVFTQYDKYNYKNLKDALYNDEHMLEIRQNSYSAVFDTRLLINTILNPNLDEVGLKLCHNDSPLLINYNYGVFDVYALIAPKLCKCTNFLRV